MARLPFDTYVPFSQRASSFARKHAKKTVLGLISIGIIAGSYMGVQHKEQIAAYVQTYFPKTGIERTYTPPVEQNEEQSAMDVSPSTAPLDTVESFYVEPALEPIVAESTRVPDVLMVDSTSLVECDSLETVLEAEDEAHQLQNAQDVVSTTAENDVKNYTLRWGTTTTTLQPPLEARFVPAYSLSDNYTVAVPAMQQDQRLVFPATPANDTYQAIAVNIVQDGKIVAQQIAETGKTLTFAADAVDMQKPIQYQVMALQEQPKHDDGTTVYTIVASYANGVVNTTPQQEVTQTSVSMPASWFGYYS